MSFKILKAKYLTDGSIHLELSKTNEKGEEYSATEDHDAPAHEDLRAAYDAAGVHLACLCGYEKTKKIKDIDNVNPDTYKDFHITSYAYSGTKDDPKITLTGFYSHELGTTTLNTKALRIEGEDENQYVFIEDFIYKVDRMDKELRAYMDGSKRGKDAQGKLDFDQQPQEGKTVVKVLPEEKPLFVTPGMANMPNADPEAMKRVASDEVEIVEEIKTPQKTKRVAQSPSNRSGIVPEA